MWLASIAIVGSILAAFILGCCLVQQHLERNAYRETSRMKQLRLLLKSDGFWMTVTWIEVTLIASLMACSVIKP